MLRELEDIIEKGLPTFIQVGEALTKIRDEKLYLEAGYEDFASYCRSRWRLSPGQLRNRLEAYSVVMSLDGPPPVYQAHALVLSSIEDETLRNIAWRQALEERGEALTAQELEGVVRRYTKIEDPRLTSLVARQVVTAAQAADLVEATTRLPDKWKVAVNQFGITDEGIVDPEALRTLRIMEHTFSDDVNDVLYSGVMYLPDKEVPFHKVTRETAEYYTKVVYGREYGGKKARASERQADDITTDEVMVVTQNISDLSNVPPETLVFYVPCGLTAEQVMSLLDLSGLDLYMVIGYTKGARMKFGEETIEVGSTEVLPPQVIKLIEEMKP